MTDAATVRRHGDDLLALYDEALPDVYGYLLHRCRRRATAEDLTAETMLAAVESIRRGAVERVTVAWLVGIARHKLVDHWRRLERDEKNLRAVETPPDHDDPWDEQLDAFAARAVLDGLGVHHRAALTLRYVDDLSVPEVASVLDRTVAATEALLVRARRAFRTRYDELHDADDPEEVTP